MGVISRTLLFLMVWLSVVNAVYAQEPDVPGQIVEGGKTFLVHQVKAGETLFSIGRKYQVDREVIVQHNPGAADGLRTGEKLKIPVDALNKEEAGSRQVTEEVRILKHKVQRKETFYFISRKYGITIDDILAYNPGISQLRKGDVLRIPQWDHGGTARAQVPLQSDATVTHWVQPGETLFSISRKYGVTVASILDEDPDAEKLKPGMRLTIRGGNNKHESSESKKENFIEHTIIQGETLYAVCRKYQVTAERILELNPGLNKSFKAGAVILIPERAVELQQEMAGEKSSLIWHVVVQGETLYSISKLYDIAIPDLVKSNPVLESRTPRTGDTLRIALAANGAVPVKEEHKMAVSEIECLEVMRSQSAKNRVRIALLLPVMLENNLHLNAEYLSSKKNVDSGTETEVSDVNLPSKKESFIQFHGSSENFIHFYEGALLAVDSLVASGINVDLKVYDTEQRTSKVSSLVSSGALGNADLIIGPVFPEQQKAISAYALKKGIPVISPLSASDEVTSQNPWFFQINPARDYMARKRDSYIISSFRNSNVLVLQTNSRSDDADREAGYLKEELHRREGDAWGTTVRILDYRQEGFSGLKNALSKERKNVVVIPSDNEAEVSVAVSNIKALAAEFDIILVGSNRFPQFDSINPDHFHQGRLEFLTPYWPDFSKPVARSFVYKFRSQFKSEPNQFSMQGYDVVFFIAKAIHDFGPDFRNCIPFASAELVQGNYHFEQVSAGGFVNDGLNVIQYTPQFQVVKKMTFYK